MTALERYLKDGWVIKAWGTEEMDAMLEACDRFWPRETGIEIARYCRTYDLPICLTLRGSIGVYYKDYEEHLGLKPRNSIWWREVLKEDKGICPIFIY